MTTWHSGAPPTIGWWPASYYASDRADIRWWNGEFWSMTCKPWDGALAASIEAARGAAYCQEEIEWSARWWL